MNLRLRRFHRLVFIICVISGTAFGQTQNCGCEDKPQIKVLAVVNGIKITKEDLSIETRTQVSLIQDTVVAARSQEVLRQINRLLIDTEAKRRGITAAQLIDLEVNGKVKQPTDKEAKAVYEEYRSRFAKDFKSVKNEIIAGLKTDREALRANEFGNALRAGAQITTSELPVTPPVNEADLDRVFATVNGVNITSRDVEQSLLPLIFRVQQQVYAFRKQDLDLKINDMLLEQEAKRLGISPQSLLNQNVKVRAPIVTEQQAREFYKNTNMRGDFKKVKFEIMQYLLEQEERKLSLAYAEQLRQAAAVQIYLTQPESPTLRQLCCNPVD